MSFMISRDGTIVQVGGVLEPAVFYDFRRGKQCPGKESWNLMYFVISRHCTIVQVGGVIEPKILYDFQ